jgi:general L-amino acid transport system permease protein
MARTTPLYRRAGVQAVFFQLLAAAFVLGAGWFLVANALDALARLGISTGFGFLAQPAGFGIGEAPIPFTAEDSYLRAFGVGLLNTLKVSALGVVLATLVGVLAGLGRLSGNIFVSAIATGYVELFRNTPQLLQIVFWYSLATNLPRPRQALEPIAGVFLSNRGLYLPWPELDGVVLAALALGVLAALVFRRHGVALALLLAFGPALLAWAATGGSLAWDRPVLRGLNFRGGARLSPEFIALLLGLGLYIGAFIAEIVRAGILSVSRGQTDAAKALGLGPWQATRLVVLPQALRLMVPPATGQYVSLVKNSSLAVAIGYPDVVNIGNTTINQTGQVVEGVLMIAAVYLTISLAIAGAMNLYNRVVMARFARA